MVKNASSFRIPRSVIPPLVRLITMSDHDLSKYATNEPPALLWFERANYIAVNLGLIAYGAHYPCVILHQG